MTYIMNDGILKGVKKGYYTEHSLRSIDLARAYSYKMHRYLYSIYL